MAETPSSGDQFLARRFNFLGLPSKRRGRAITYPALRAELGDDNAAALVVKIGELVKAHGLDRLGVPEHIATDRILQSLTSDERRTMAQGGTVPRVEAIITAEAAAAKQQKQAAVNIHGSGDASGKAVNAMFGRQIGVISNRGGNQFSELREKSASSDTGAGAGLYKALGAEGYTRQQIASAINFTKSIGIDDASYAGYFVGSSKRTRDAIAAHIRDGRQVTDDDVEKPDDVAAVIGAVKAKKMKSEEAPPSVQGIMGQMKKDGVDPATAKPQSIHKWLKKHPGALDAAKREAHQDLAAKAGTSTADIQAESKRLEEKRSTAPEAKGDSTKVAKATPPKPPQAASTLF